MAYAGQQVLRRQFGAGRYGTRRGHGDRWRVFSQVMRSEYGIRDMRLITADHVREFVDTRLENGYAATTLHNDVSTVNVILEYASEGRWHPLSPRALVGPRTNVRREAPTSYALDMKQVVAAMGAFHRAAVAFALGLTFGVRSREASLADVLRWINEAEMYGAINITDGTKGGRGKFIDRWVPVTPQGAVALTLARAAVPGGSRNLLRPSESYQQWRDGELRRGRDALHQVGIRGYHDARAAYACTRYRGLAGHEAPAVAGERLAERAVDRAARAVIAEELGHGRIAVTSAYLGSAK